MRMELIKSEDLQSLLEETSRVLESLSLNQNPQPQHPQHPHPQHSGQQYTVQNQSVQQWPVDQDRQGLQHPDQYYPGQYHQFQRQQVQQRQVQQRQVQNSQGLQHPGQYHPGQHHQFQQRTVQQRPAQQQPVQQQPVREFEQPVQNHYPTQNFIKQQNQIRKHLRYSEFYQQRISELQNRISEYLRNLQLGLYTPIAREQFSLPSAPIHPYTSEPDLSSIVDPLLKREHKTPTEANNVFLYRQYVYSRVINMLLPSKDGKQHPYADYITRESPSRGIIFTSFRRCDHLGILVWIEEFGHALYKLIRHQIKKLKASETYENMGSRDIEPEELWLGLTGPHGDDQPQWYIQDIINYIVINRRPEKTAKKWTVDWTLNMWVDVCREKLAAFERRRKEDKNYEAMDED